MNTLPSAVLFDHDGVLVASESLHWAAWGQLLSNLGLPYHETDVRKLVGKTGPEILSALLDRYSPGWSPKKYDVDALAWKKNDYYLERLQRDLKPYPGVVDGLKWLKSQGVRTAVVSNAKRRELSAAIEALGLLPYFDEVLSRDECPAPKPDPTPYLMGAASLEVEPERCLAIEDSPPGLESALMGKIPAAAVTTNFPAEVLRQPVLGRPDLKPVWVGASMVEFFEWLKLLPQRTSTSAS